jgi:cell division protein FtsZ
VIDIPARRRKAEANMTGSTDIREMKARIVVLGVGGAGGNAVNNMIASGLEGVEFIVANTDAQALASSRADRVIQIGTQVTQGLGAGAQPEVGRAAAEEAIDEIRDHLNGAHMAFVTAGMGGGTGTGAAPVIARIARELGILTIGVVTKPFFFEGQRRMRFAEAGIAELLKAVDTLLVIPNQNLFRVANDRTTFTDAFVLADQVLYSGVACISDLIVKEGLINLDFADVLTVMREKGKAMMGRGEASGEKRVLDAAVAAISNPLIENPSIKRASGLIISITGGRDLMLYEVDEAASRIREEVDEDANIIVGATFDDSLEGIVRVSVVATGIDNIDAKRQTEPTSSLTELASRLRNENLRTAERIQQAAPRPQAASPAYHPAPQPAARHIEQPQPRLMPDYARTAAPRELDTYGRLAAVRNSIEQAVLEIPAFLGRGAK